MGQMRRLPPSRLLLLTVSLLSGVSAASLPARRAWAGPHEREERRELRRE